MPTEKTDWVVYLVRCSDGTFYCGMSSDLDARIAVHNTGRGAKYTRGRGPVTLAWAMTAQTKSAAMSLEALVKKMSRKEKEELVADFVNPV